MKLGIVGKGGVGKTTVSSLLARGFEATGRRVIAVDTDSNPNLGMSLGLTLAETEAIPVIPRNLAVGSGTIGTDDLLGQFSRQTPAGVRLLSAMRVDEAGAGCTCGHHAAVRSLLGRALEDHAEVAIVDMEAGLEHLSRSGGTLAHADILVVVMEPTRKSIVTASRTRALAEELGIPRTYGLGNKARLPADGEFFAEACGEHGVELCGVIPDEPAIAAADRAGSVVDGLSAPVRDSVDALIAFLDSTAVGIGT